MMLAKLLVIASESSYYFVKVSFSINIRKGYLVCDYLSSQTLKNSLSYYN